MRKLFDWYTIVFIVFVILMSVGRSWTDKVCAQPTNSVAIAKPGLIKFDWTSGNLDYKGINANSDAADSDTDWQIYKYTWDGSNPTSIKERQGAWSNRASLFP